MNIEVCSSINGKSGDLATCIVTVKNPKRKYIYDIGLVGSGAAKLVVSSNRLFINMDYLATFPLER